MLAVLFEWTARYESSAAGSGGPDTNPRCRAAPAPAGACASAMLPTPILTTTAPLTLRHSRGSTIGVPSTWCLSLSRTAHLLGCLHPGRRGVRGRHRPRRALNGGHDPRIRTAPADMT